jgi:hypothetical protein
MVNLLLAEYNKILTTKMRKIKRSITCNESASEELSQSVRVLEEFSILRQRHKGSISEYNFDEKKEQIDTDTANNKEKLN